MLLRDDANIVVNVFDQGFQLRLCLVEPPIHLRLHAFKPPIDRFEPLVDSVEPSIDGVKALIDSDESLVDGVEPLLDDRLQVDDGPLDIRESIFVHDDGS